uniref:Secreted protein n=1 Tax=Schistosoma curassoni TaxID=6186 RepID=A0A183JMM5_9TREM
MTQARISSPSSSAPPASILESRLGVCMPESVILKRTFCSDGCCCCWLNSESQVRVVLSDALLVASATASLTSSNRLIISTLANSPFLGLEGKTQ